MKLFKTLFWRAWL